MNRLWSQVGIRTASVALLMVGVVGGFYLGQDREVQQQGIEADLAAQADAAAMEMLKERHGQHAAARAPQRVAEIDAAVKAAGGAKLAARKARSLAKAVIKKKAAEAAAKKQAAQESKPYDGPIPDSCNEYSGNRKVGCALMLNAGFGLNQFPCLNKLWNKESGWNHRARNRSSGAYGIPQALPGDKMGDVAGDWRTNPATQIKWGLRYIKGRYNTPCGAWSHSQRTGWY